MNNISCSVQKHTHTDTLSLMEAVNYHQKRCIIQYTARIFTFLIRCALIYSVYHSLCIYVRLSQELVSLCVQNKKTYYGPPNCLCSRYISRTHSDRSLFLSSSSDGAFPPRIADITLLLSSSLHSEGSSFVTPAWVLFINTVREIEWRQTDQIPSPCDERSNDLIFISLQCCAR